MRFRVLGLAAAASLMLVAAPAADAARVPCVVGTKGPKCTAWTAKGTDAADGDTFRPKVKQSNGWSDKVTVRMIGIQAPELSSYSRAHGRKGNCMGVEAAEELDKLLKGEYRLVAMKAGSTTQGKRVRLRRTVQVKRGGRWVDPAMVLLQKGLALWFPNGSDEWPWNGAYARIAEQAAAKGVGLWDPNACGKPGPSESSPLSMKVKWDAEGTDGSRTNNGEWVRIKNLDPVNPVPLAGWTLRDSDLRGQKMQSGYRFPSNAVVPAGGSITVKVGRGNGDSNTFFWGLDKVIFDNASADKKQMGDGAYLFDPHSEMRAHVQYPCRTTCGDPLDGKLTVTARYMGIEHEWITVLNHSAEWISLNEYEVENVPWFYEFGPRDILAPGTAVTLWVRSPHDVPADVSGRKLFVTPEPGLSIPGLRDFESSSTFLSWNYDKGMLADDGDVVVVRNPQGAPVGGACHKWGRFSCPKA